MTAVRFAQHLSSSNSKLFLQFLHQAHSAPGFGVTNSVASRTLDVLPGGLAGVRRLLRLSFVDDSLEPVLAGFRFAVNAGGGTSTFVDHGPAPDANNRSRRILAVAPVADNDWPSRLLPRGVDPVRLSATFRWAECSIGRG